MEIESRIQDDVLILTPKAERLDANCTVVFKERMHALSVTHKGQVRLDMSGIQFMDSSGLGALVAAMKGLGHGRRLELADCTQPVMRVLTLTRMDRVFVLCDSGAPSQGTAA
ncbi:MAG: STAS domain-containing protein [Pseudomonadota bacterium]